MATLCDSNLYVHQQEQGQLLDSDAALVNLPATPPSRRLMYQTQSVYCCAHCSNHSKPPTHASEQTGRLACCRTRSPAKCRSLSCFFASEWRYALECVTAQRLRAPSNSCGLQELQAERDKERALQKQAAVPVSVRARKLASATPEGEATPLTMVPKGEMTVVQEQELKHQSTKVQCAAQCKCHGVCGTDVTHANFCVQALWDVVKREVDLHRQSNLLEHYQAAFARIKVRFMSSCTFPIVTNTAVSMILSCRQALALPR